MTSLWKKSLPFLGCGAAFLFAWFCFSGDAFLLTGSVDNSSFADGPDDPGSRPDPPFPIVPFGERQPLTEPEHPRNQFSAASSAKTILGNSQPGNQGLVDGTRNDPNIASPALELSSITRALTDEDLQILQSLPPMCTSDLPGLDLSENSQVPQPNLVTEPNIAQSSFSQPDFGKENVATANAEHPEARIGAELAGAELAADKFAGGKASLPGGDFDYSAPLGTPAESETHETASQPVRRDAMLINPHANASAQLSLPRSTGTDTDPHLEVFSRTAYPSATACASCHQQIFDEWAASSHAYAAVSPMFNAFEDKVNKLTQGTIGYFCLRCHAPVATTMGLRRDQAIWDGPRVFREGVTCVACHRVKTPYGKVNGERRIEPGDIYQPVYGAGDGNGVEIANKYRSLFNLKTDPQDPGPGQPIHQRAIQFEELSKSTFCASCHQVAVAPGIKLEVVWDQYRASPAYRDGVTCQECHMGKVPGVDAGYSVGPGAVVDNKVINAEKQHSNHIFYGPGYSIAHPGVFPDNPKADRWSFNQWLEFDWRAGWGTEAFEDALAEGSIQTSFPPAWQHVDDRYDAREIVDANLKTRNVKRDLRRQVLENGSKLDGPFFAESPAVNQTLKFRYCLTNTNPGHNLPSGSLGAQPQVWLNAVLIDPEGNRIWETGYVDSNGDLADQHSLDVLARRIPLDKQLMNLQTKFLTTNVKGTDREMYLPINFDLDQLPFIRPAPEPVSVLNHPPLIRMEAHSIPPLGSRNAKYSVPARLIQAPGIYRLSVRMRSRMEPIYFMKFCNATAEMERAMNEGICDFHVSTVTFQVHP